ncbi:hypothetical protein AE07_01509 [Enterobacter cloacae BWH 43]|nr:hypothetical protein AE07_01509 [Enterobacter cloacae BWH 43]
MMAWHLTILIKGILYVTTENQPESPGHPLAGAKK